MYWESAARIFTNKESDCSSMHNQNAWMLSFVSQSLGALFAAFDTDIFKLNFLKATLLIETLFSTNQEEKYCRNLW